MNKFSVNKNIIIEKEIENPFCRKFFNKNKLNKCVMFLLNNEKRGQILCPYAYSCAKSVDTIYCGFSVDGCSDIKRIKGHAKFSGAKKIERYSKEEYDLIWDIAHMQDCCSVYSQTAHDLIHFSGQLKSLIDEAFQYSQQDKFINHLIKEYQKYITLIDGYRKKSEENWSKGLLCAVWSWPEDPSPSLAQFLYLRGMLEDSEGSRRGRIQEGAGRRTRRTTFWRRSFNWKGVSY